MHKLARLPRHQRLRKAERILAAAEQRLAGAPQSPADEGPASGDPAYLAGLLGLLAVDGEFAPPERRVFEQAAHCAAQHAVAPHAAARPAPPGHEFRRALNAARHALLAATGRSPSDWDFIDDQGGLDGRARRIFPGTRLYLEDIRSPFNVGAMFRAAESFGIEKLWLSPLCADPRHRRALRSAMGCVDALPWERREAEEALGPPRAGEGEALPCFALETGGIDIAEFTFPRRGTLIVGSEELGVSPETLERADASLGRLSIRTWGAKGSLNASVACGIALQRWAEALSSSGP